MMSEKESNPRYLKIIETSRDLFWKHGLKRVTVEEICRKAGVSKMTFYKFFPNKVELAKYVYAREIDIGMKRFREIMSNEDTTAQEKMEQMLMMKMEGTNDISREFLGDFYSNPELGLSKWVEEKGREAWREMIQDFRDAQRKGWFRGDFKPEGFLFIVNKFSEMITDENLLSLYGTPQEAIMEFSRFFTFGIMPHDKKEDKGNFRNLT
jgi:AcrR family transcriptional regulator